MTNYNNVFGNDSVPPSQYGFQSLTITSDQSASWPYNYSGDGIVISKIMEVTNSVGNAFTFPSADQVSPGEDFLIRNVGAQTLTLKNSAGTTISTVLAGAATYFYVKDNSTAAGTWGQVAYGAGSASISAAALVGYGLQAASSLVNVSFPVASSSALTTIVATNQASLYNYTGGTGTLGFAAAATLGNAFWMMFANNGTGTVTLDPNGAELIDGASSKTIQPGESCLVLCSGSGLYTVGYGRSTLYQFTQLVLDVSAAGTFTLSSAQAANKLLTFIGSPASTVTVVVPNVVAVYYVQSSISTAQTIIVKTAAGTGVNIPQSQRVICICDATNVSAAQSVAVTSSVSYPDGSAAAPSANFASQTNTGFYKKGTFGIGFAVNGAEVGYFNSDGSGFTIPGALVVSGASTLAGAVSVVDGNFSIKGSGDSTKIAKFEVDGLTTATTRTLTVPDANFTIVGAAVAQALTNKTIDKALNTLIGVAGSGPNVDISTLALTDGSTMIRGFNGSLSWTVNNTNAGAAANAGGYYVSNSGSLSVRMNSLAANGFAYFETDGTAGVLSSDGRVIRSRDIRPASNASRTISVLLDHSRYAPGRLYR